MLYHLVGRYMTNLSKEQVSSFAVSKGANLSEEELEFVYEFIKKNWEQVLKNPSLLNLERYQDRFSSENFSKIKQLFQEYSSKYQAFLK